MTLAAAHEHAYAIVRPRNHQPQASCFQSDHTVPAQPVPHEHSIVPIRFSAIDGKLKLRAHGAAGIMKTFVEEIDVDLVRRARNSSAQFPIQNITTDQL